MRSARDSTSPSAAAFPDSVQFQKSWRLYQTRILDRLNEYLSDRRVHLVAAPGSGKTILGIEIIRRIGEPTLVLAPTITIRDQWVDRLTGCFLATGGGVPEWVSVDLRSPAQLTIATYQALHSLCAPSSGQSDSPEGEGDDQFEGAEIESSNGETGNHTVRQLPDIVVLAGFRTLVVDEAHHLRSEWWKTLTFVAGHLHQPTVVALTATPPYDVLSFEWQRYEELCGPVDAEVSAPELVREGDLCPHQDYVYLSVPRRDDLKIINDFRQSVQSFVERLRTNRDFVQAIATHPWIVAPHDNVSALLDDPEYLSSMVIFLNAAGSKVSHQLLDVLGLSSKRIPGLDLAWVEILLTRCLYADAQSFPAHEPTLKSIRRDLLQIGAIERRRVTLRSSVDHLKLLTTSVTKLESIVEIIRLEAGAQQLKLRAVILADYIRKTDLPKTPTESCSFEDIGVVPIFETLRKAEIAEVRLGVLSGSLVLVPASALPAIHTAAKELGRNPEDLTVSPVPHAPAYRSITIRGEYYNGNVRLITSIFQKGEINVLVGTKALLGEGWDAPCINTLVLASFVGSYVLSNQMRGRSIRIDPEHQNKTANIWHLVCLEPGVLGPGPDYELLTRRCNAFAGVSATSPVIESGTDRLGIGSPPFSVQQIEERNRQMCARALDREGLTRQWKAALDAGAVKQMVHGVNAPEETLPRGYVLRNTIGVLLVDALSVFVILVLEFMRALGRARPRNEQDLVSTIIALLVIATLASLPWLCLALWRFIRHGTPEKSLRQIGEVVLNSLEYAGEIDARSGDFHVYAERQDEGSVFCWIGGGTGRDQSSFLEALRQILRPVENPRYLLARPRFWRWFFEDYFAVPEALARKKEFAEFFAKQWRRFVGPVQLVYTRTPEGRRYLLRARGHSLAASFQKRSERVSCWK